MPHRRLHRVEGGIGLGDGVLAKQKGDERVMVGHRPRLQTSARAGGEPLRQIAAGNEQVASAACASATCGARAMTSGTASSAAFRSPASRRGACRIRSAPVLVGVRPRRLEISRLRLVDLPPRQMRIAQRSLDDGDRRSAVTEDRRNSAKPVELARPHQRRRKFGGDRVTAVAELRAPAQLLDRASDVAPDAG